jgi:hypothetical protein
MSLQAALIRCWKLELQAAEAASDRIRRLAHMGRAARFAKRAARENARQDPRLALAG